MLAAALASLLRLSALGVDVVGDHGLDTELGVTVRVGRAERALFGDGDHVGEAGCIAVDGRRGREDDVGDVVLGHAAQEAERAEDVDAVVLERDLARLADGLVKRVSVRWFLRFPTINVPDSHALAIALLTFNAAKWMTLSMSGCASKILSSSFSSVMSAE